MSSIYPVPIGRSSTVLAHAQILHQLQSSSLDLLKTQAQIGSGRRVLLPSDDPRASTRAIALQRILEQKTQAKANLSVSQDYLRASDSALASAGQALINVRASALTAVTNVATDTERQTVVAEIESTIDNLLSLSNTEYRGRALFAGGAAAATAYRREGAGIAYAGNDERPVSLVDVERLAASGLTGGDVLGAYTAGPVGTVDLQPAVTRRTALADLHGGIGVSGGFIEVSDGSTVRPVDLTGVQTVGDVVDRLEASRFPGRRLLARIEGDRLSLSFDGTPGWELSVREVGGGRTAAELGLPAGRPVQGRSLVGTGLAPRLTAATSLADAFGIRATGVAQTAADNNDLRITAVARGADGNALAVHFVDDRLLRARGGVTAGRETVEVAADGRAARASLRLAGPGNDLVLTATAVGAQRNNLTIAIVDGGPIGDAATAAFDPATGVLSLGVDSGGATSVGALVQAIDGQGLFTAAHDAGDAADGAFSPAGTVAVGDIGVAAGRTGSSGGDPGTVFVHVEAGFTTANDVVEALAADPAASALVRVELENKDAPDPFRRGEGLVAAQAVRLAGGAGREPDLASGLQLTVGDTTRVVDLAGATTVGDLLARLSPPSLGVIATLSPDGRGITVRSTVAGASFSVGENGGTTAADLGIRSFSAATPLAGLGQGRGVERKPGADLTIRRSDGVSLDVDLDGAHTVGDVLTRINGHPANVGPAGRVTASLSKFGNGIVLSEFDPVSSAGPTVVKPPAAGSAVYDLGLVPPGATTTTAADVTPPTSARLAIAWPPPGDRNSALKLAGPPGDGALDGVRVIFADTGAVTGNNAAVAFDGTAKTLTIDLQSGVTTAATVRDAITAAGPFAATLDTTADPTNNGSGTVAAAGAVGTTSGASPAMLVGRDPGRLENQSVFDMLLKLRDAVRDGRTGEIGRQVERLDAAITRLNGGRADLGQRAQALDTLEQRILDEEVELKAAISGEIDVDLAEAISRMTLQQAAMQASLQLTGQAVRLTLLSFL